MTEQFPAFQVRSSTVLLILFSGWSLVTLVNYVGKFAFTALRSPKIKFANLNKIGLYPQRHSPWHKSYNFV